MALQHQTTPSVPCAVLTPWCCVVQASEYIFKYIIQSRRLYSLATGGQNEDEFRICVHELFMSIRFFLSQENKAACPVTQTQVCVRVCVCVCVCLCERIFSLTHNESHIMKVH